MNGPGFRLSHMAELLGLRLQGEDMTVTGVNTLEEAGPTEVSFLANPKYASQLADTRAGPSSCGPSTPMRCAAP